MYLFVYIYLFIYIHGKYIYVNLSWNKMGLTSNKGDFVKINVNIVGM